MQQAHARSQRTRPMRLRVLDVFVDDRADLILTAALFSNLLPLSKNMLATEQFPSSGFVGHAPAAASHN